jgi:hypothetical protein
MIFFRKCERGAVVLFKVTLLVGSGEYEENHETQFSVAFTVGEYEQGTSAVR